MFANGDGIMEERQIRTGIDRFLDLVNAGKELKLSDASKKLGVPESTLETWADILLKESLVEIGYDGFGKMVVRRSLVKKPEAEGPITELPKSAPPKAAEHRMSLRERLSGMKRNKGHKLLKKYSAARKNTPVPDKGSIVSRFLTLVKGSFKKPDLINSAQNPQRASVRKHNATRQNRKKGISITREDVLGARRKEHKLQRKKAA